MRFTYKPVIKEINVEPFGFTIVDIYISYSYSKIMIDSIEKIPLVKVNTAKQQELIKMSRS